MINPLQNSAKIILITCFFIMSGCGAEADDGPQGETGLVGEAGPQGETGAQGETGPQGIQGVQGPIGATGIQGETGLQGDTGPQGATGPQGQIGIQGATGVQGNTGAQGIQGEKGDTGASSLWLSPSDLMLHDSQTWVSKTKILMNGYYQEVIKIEKDNTQYWGSVAALVPLPKGWDEATSVTMTTYYELNEPNGDLLIYQGANGFKVGEMVSTWGHSPIPLTPAGDANTLYSLVTDITSQISPQDELLSIGFQRYMLEGGSPQGDDSNLGNVYVVAIKLEAEI